ncbi:hypothetical protein TYRP_023758 [Tyrophagus putrescentiae]|nr:hypothetical protein TYRP_023758 [Tyrophagus putrescentiae]
MTSSLKPPPEAAPPKVEVDSPSPDLSGGQTVTASSALKAMHLRAMSTRTAQKIRKVAASVTLFMTFSNRNCNWMT